MVTIEKGSSVFKPRARLLSLLGEQLITNEVIAVVELVKNAFDADATLVTLLLKNVSDMEEGEIIIEISLASYHSSAITSEGRMYTWGRNANGQLVRCEQE